MSVNLPQAVEPDDVEYPESDGEPMGETGLHVDELIALRQALRHVYRGRDDVYVGANMFVYYERGKPSSVFCPDVYVAFGVSAEERRTYKLWVEGRPPSFVLELSSRKTWLEDTGNKKALCERLGVAEYFLFDPEGDYLEPRLQGYRLVGGEYRRIPAAEHGILESRVVGLRLRAEGRKLQYFVARTGERLLRDEERALALDRAEEERRRAEEERRRAEERARAAEERATTAEAELAELRRRLAER